MFIHSNKEIDKKVNVSKIANNLNTLGDDSTEARCTPCLRKTGPLRLFGITLPKQVGCGQFLAEKIKKLLPTSFA